jgi:hypothetical protein
LIGIFVSNTIKEVTNLSKVAATFVSSPLEMAPRYAL